MRLTDPYFPYNGGASRFKLNDWRQTQGEKEKKCRSKVEAVWLLLSRQY